MNIKLKRIYDEPAKNDGLRILVDRLWPRGIKKEDANIDAWVKELSPSNELRKWFHKDKEKTIQILRKNIKKNSNKGKVT